MTLDIDELRELLAAATKGPWEIYLQEIEGAGQAKVELCAQVDATDPIGDTLFLLSAGGKCPATTGCGPTSYANAALIVAAVNALPELLDTLTRLSAENERMREALAEATSWLRAALDCEGFHWDADQWEAAEFAHDAARQALSPKTGRGDVMSTTRSLL